MIKQKSIRLNSADFNWPTVDLSGPDRTELRRLIESGRRAYLIGIALMNLEAKQ